MDTDSDDGDYTTYDLMERLFNSMPGPSAQECHDCIGRLLLSCLPAPYVPIPEEEPDADDDSFSFTSSVSEASDDGAGHPAPYVPIPEEEPDADDDSFSFTSSVSEASDDGAGHDAFAFAAAPGDGEDRISRLPDTLLADIIHRLPTKDAGRTAVLSTHWRRVWAGTPLLVDVAHFLGAGGTSDVPVVRALSRCVAAHPGPVRGVRVTGVSFYEHKDALRRLVADLADKDVQDLILVNRPWLLDMPLPDDILRCASLKRLYLGEWEFPKTTASHPPAFPDLRELGLLSSDVPDDEFESLLAHCPRLEVLSLAMSYNHQSSRLRLASNSLKIAVEWMSFFDEVVVEDAPSLERLLFYSIPEVNRRLIIKILRSPRLEVLGVLDLDLHELEIGGTLIKAGMNVSARNMVPSLKILAVKVQLACDRDANMLWTLLKCFPRLETLHVMPTPSKSPDSAHDLRFWEHRGPCECLESHLETVIAYGCLAEGHGIGFLRYIMKEGKVLKTIASVCSDEKATGFRAVGGSGEVTFCVATTPHWSFQAAIDLSLDDPFCAVRAQA